MTGPSPTLKARVDPKRASDFEALAKARHLTASKLLRAIVYRELDQAGHVTAEQDVENDESDAMRLRIALPGRFWTEIERLSARAGLSPQRWIAETVCGVVSAAVETSSAKGSEVEPDQAQLDTARMTVRLPQFLAEGVEARAKRRGMSVNRWVVALVQSNLMRHPVFADDELRAFEDCNRELFAIGRNINQMARVLNEAHFKTEQVRIEKLNDLASYIRKTRDSIRALIRSSRSAWRDEE